MNIVDRQKIKHVNGIELAGNDSNEGTAARTRPLSFEEVMLRRRNKKHITEAKEGAGESRESFKKDYTENASDHSGSAVSDKLTKDSKYIVKGRSKKKEEITSNKDVGHLKGKDKRRHDLEDNMKVKSDYDKSRDRERKHEKRSHRRSKADDLLKADVEKVSGKKHSKDTAVKDKYGERDIKSRQENKRKHHSGSDENTRSKRDGSISKKRDYDKWQDMEHQERKGRKYDEPRLKRRRSRSRENDYDRDRRSISVSPRAHKQSYHGRDKSESSFHSFKDRSGRQYSDADKYRTSGNGVYESVHYRRRGSGLGGYSPRKRRTEAAVKTPSPTIRSPEKKVATWDQPPVGTNHAATGSMLANFLSSSTKAHELSATISVTSTPMKPQPTPLPITAPKVLNTSIDSVQLTQATRPSRRLYIENLPASASEKAVVEWLNDFLLSSGASHIQQTQPCISCIINKEKCHAVVEFLTPEDATAAFSFDGRSFRGSVLKIRRPKDLVETTELLELPDILYDILQLKGASYADLTKTGDLEKLVPVVDAISDDVKDSPRKIFVGGISKALSSDMLKEIFTVFGQLKAYHFEFNEELNQPCAFLEYVEESITLRACAGLNGMKLAGHILTVVKALPDAHGEEEYAEGPPSYNIPEHAKPLLENPTHVLKLKNVFNQEEFLLLSEPELEETLEDIRLECARFGTIKSINIVRCSGSYNNATEAVEQDPNGELGKIETIEEPPGSETKTNGVVTSLNDFEEPENVVEVSEPTNINDENSMKYVVEKESSDPAETDKDATQEVPTQPNTTGTGKPLTGYQKVADVKVEEGPSMENSLDREELKLEDVNTKLKEHSTESDIAIVKKTERSNEDDKPQTNGLDVFEPGCVLVEFLREEATCLAAHCLNGRRYSDRVVATCYVSHDAYLAQFPR